MRMQTWRRQFVTRPSLWDKRERCRVPGKENISLEEVAQRTGRGRSAIGVGRREEAACSTPHVSQPAQSVQVQSYKNAQQQKDALSVT